MPVSEPYPVQGTWKAHHPPPAHTANTALWPHLATAAWLTAAVSCPALALWWAGPWTLLASVPLSVALVSRRRAAAAAARAADQADAEKRSAASAPELLADAIPLPANPAQVARLGSHVVPVWQRNVEAARQHSERSMSLLLESFAGVASHLDRALSDANGALQLDIGAADQLLALHQAEVDNLTGLSRTAVGLQREMRDEALGFAAELAEMGTLTREVQNIGRATHLLALNTSVEANRAGGASGGFMVVAHEVRQLAGQSREAGSRLARHVSSMQARLADLERKNRRENLDDDEEIDVRAEQAARAVVLGLLDSLSRVTQSARQLRLAGAEVQADLEKIFIGLQSQDRLSQMLSSVTDDMARYTNWLHGATDPDAATPALWLERLEKSYTMEELRSSHHGNTVVEQGSSVEFF